MEGVTLDGQRSVLIVDQSEETREVLQTALERRGMRIFAASGVPHGLELARQHRPDLIVLDLEVENTEPAVLSASFAEQSGGNRAVMVMLGSVRRHRLPLPDGEFVSKPYHYGPLVRRIEQLLDTVPQALARAA